MITQPPKPIQDFLDGEIKFINKYLKKDKFVLEVGCGYGRLLKILQQKSSRLVGIDFSKKMVNAARINTSQFKNVDIKLMNAEKLSFNNNLFDYVLCLDNSFGNMPGIEQKVINEMYRVCKPGGKIIISVFSDSAKNVQIKNYNRIGLKNVRNIGDAIYTDDGFYSRRFTKKQLSRLFTKAGLKCKIISVCPVNYIAYAKKPKTHSKRYYFQ